MWKSISFVTTGVSLVAFLFAAAAWAYAVAASRNEKRIRLAPEKDRARLIEATLEFIKIDTNALTKQQKYDIALTQIQARIRRTRIFAVVIVIIAFLTAGVSVVALWRDIKMKLPTALISTSTPVPLPTATQRPPLNESPRLAESPAHKPPPTPLRQSESKFQESLLEARQRMKLGKANEACVYYQKALNVLPDSRKGQIDYMSLREANKNYQNDDFTAAAKHFEKAFRNVTSQ